MTTDQISHSRVLKIAIPVVLSNASIPLLGIVDTGVVGQLGDPVPIGAVGLGAIIIGSIYWLFGFLRMGTTGLAAQALGAGDGAEVSALLTRVLLFGGAAGLVLIALQWPLFAAALWLSPGSDAVEASARTYMAVRMVAAPAAIALFGIMGWLIAQERTGAVLLLQLVQNGTNIALSAALGLWLGWGVFGVAMATVIAEIVGLALGLWLCRSGFSGSAWRHWPTVFDGAKLRRMAVVNTDILSRSALIMASLTSFLFFAADLGDVPLAATQVLIQFLYITSYVMDGMAYAAESLVGQAVGARAGARLRRATWSCSAWGIGLAVVMSAVFAIGGGAMIDLMTTSEPVRAEARVYLIWLVILPVIAMPAFVIDGVFIGATWTREMRNMMILSALLYAVAGAAFVPFFATHGLWAALVVFFGARGLTLLWRYPRLAATVGAPI